MESMQASSQPILLIEDSASLTAAYVAYLRDLKIQVHCCETGASVKAMLNEMMPSVILLDIQLPDCNGMELLQYFKELQLPSAIIIITAHGSAEIAVDAMRLGAFDFLTKPFDKNRLLVTVNNALQHVRLNTLVEIIKEDFGRNQYHGFIGGSLVMQAVYRIIDSAASSKATVFVTGESGTGKELCAEAVHKQSPRKKGPFVAVNCAAIPKDLMESEMFGHVKGAFTGAASERKGAAAQADGGTLFLDEICEMDLDLQSKLLRFIQTGSYQKVGGSRLEKVDVRFVCATNRDPMAEVKAGRFREDLYYRLHVIPIVLPPLKERDNDVLLVANKFLKLFSQEESKSFTSFAPEVERCFSVYPWPGNIRELQNVVRNIVVLHDETQVKPEMLPPPIDAFLQASGDTERFATPMKQVDVPHHHVTQLNKSTEIIPLWQVEKHTIDQAIEICAGNIPKAAALLEISASTIYRKRQQWAAQDGVSS